MRSILDATPAATIGGRAMLDSPSDKSILIDGEWVAGESGTLVESLDPSTGRVIGRFPDATAGDVDRAVTAAPIIRQSGR